MSSRRDTSDSFSMPGPIRRNSGLLLVVLVGIVLAPFINRVIKTYRAIVLEQKSEKMFIAYEKRAPEWVSSVPVPAGTVIEKHAFSWNPQAVAADDAIDAPLFELYLRYIREYEGVIKEIRAPTRPGGASVAVVRTTDDDEVLVPLWGQHLDLSAPGRRLRKKHGDWEPYLVDEKSAPTRGVQLAPIPEPKPDDAAELPPNSEPADGGTENKVGNGSR